MADTFAYFMIVVVGAMLVTGAIVAYVYYRKNKRYRAASLQEQNPSPAQ
jgi:predicted histidine transporter YuiF (NhaC family)